MPMRNQLNINDYAHHISHIIFVSIFSLHVVNVVGLKCQHCPLKCHHLYLTGKEEWKRKYNWTEGTCKYMSQLRRESCRAQGPPLRMLTLGQCSL